MKRLGFWYCVIGVVMAVLVITGSLASAAQRGPPHEMIKGAYQQILGAVSQARRATMR
jgi:hypothetical protein